MHDPNEYYLFLGANPTDSMQDIHHAYQLQALRAHQQGGFLLEMVTAAYRCLSDQASRAAYDAGRYPLDQRIRAFRDIMLKDGRLHRFDQLQRDVRIMMYCEVLGSDDVTVDLEMQPDGTLLDPRTGERLELIPPKDGKPAGTDNSPNKDEPGANHWPSPNSGIISIRWVNGRHPYSGDQLD